MRNRLTDIWYCINQQNLNRVEDVHENPSGGVTPPEGEGIMHYTIEITHSCTTNLSPSHIATLIIASIWLVVNNI